MADVIPEIANRRARRAFANRPVPGELLDALWEAAGLAPSHGNTQPARILVARDPVVRERLFAACSPGNRNWAGAAPVLAAVCSDSDQETPQTNSDGTTRDLGAFCAGIVLGNVLAQATGSGLIVHPMAGFDEPAVRAAFEAPANVRVHVVIAIGFEGDPMQLPEDLRAKETAPQVRLPADIFVAEDRWTARNATTWRQYRDSLPGGRT
ncbi:MAG: nitroreductase family protein [Dehalococcoidia bacterium]|nr:nitroreductase family protein [Dehalococcoidia bacterium]